MPADRRSWVTLVAQNGIASLVDWCRDPGSPPRLTVDVFGAAPRELVRVVALKQTVDLINPGQTKSVTLRLIYAKQIPKAYTKSKAKQ